MNPPASNSPLNPAQQQHLAALAASASDSVRAAIILCVLAAKRLALQEGAPKQSAAMSCKQIHQWVNLPPHSCSYEATRKLLKSLAGAGFAELWHKRYILADSVAASLAKLGSTSATTAPSETNLGEFPATGASRNQPVGTPATHPGGTAADRPSGGVAADDETNKKAVAYFVQLAANHRGFLRSTLYWHIGCCRATSLAHLGAAASGLATAIMRGAPVSSVVSELQAILDGTSAIQPSSVETFVFAYEAYTRETTAELQSMADAAKAKAMEPYVNRIRELFLKKLTPQAAPAADTVPTDNSSGAPASTVEEQHPLAPVFQLPLPYDYGNAA